VAEDCSLFREKKKARKEKKRKSPKKKGNLGNQLLSKARGPSKSLRQKRVPKKKGSLGGGSTSSLRRRFPIKGVDD